MKFMMIVSPDGHILEAESPYLANGWNNDASILKHDFEPEGHNGLLQGRRLFHLGQRISRL